MAETPTPDCTRETRENPTVIHALLWVGHHTCADWGRWVCTRCGYVGPMLED